MNVTWATLIAVSLWWPTPGRCEPDANAGGLPAVDTVLLRMAEKAKADDDEREFKRHYGFTRIRVTEVRNPKGEIKKREEKKIEHHPAALAAEDSAPFSGTRPPSSDKTRVDRSGATHAKPREKDEIVLDDDLLRRFEFTLTNREDVNGRRALVIEFQPAKKDLPERTLKDRFVNRTAGRIWVDEAEYALVKADFHLTEKVNLFGGLVGTISKFSFGFRRERTELGCWFTRDSEWHLEGREVFVRQTMDFHEEKTGVRRVLPPAAPSSAAASAR